jgi:3-methyladenine DNA glycosylase AlkD
MSSSAHPATTTLQEVFSAQAVRADAEAMQAYMKDVAPFYGIKTGPRRILQKEVWKDHALPAPGAEAAAFASGLFALPQRELHYAALETLQAIRKGWTEVELPLFESLLRTKPWWDTVDVIATKLIAPFFQKFPARMRETARRWNGDESMWVRRASIIFQIPYKAKTDEVLLFDNIRATMHEKEFFIRKGIGWALREYAKAAPEPVQLFVEAEPLSPLSKREATKHLG